MPEKTQPLKSTIHDLFATRLYRAEKIVPDKLNNAIEALSMSLAVDNERASHGARSMAIRATRPTPRSTTCPGAFPNLQSW